MLSHEQERVYWTEGLSSIHDGASLAGESYEVVVVGAGYAGLNAAVELARAGKKVLVVDARAIGEGASSKAAGSLANVPKARLHDLERRYGAPTAADVYREFVLARSYTQRLIEDNGIACDLQRSTRVLAAHSTKAQRRLQREFPSMQALLPATRLLARDELRTFIGDTAYHGGLLVPDCATVNPARYQFGLARLAQSLGVQILQRTRMVGLQQTSDGYRVDLAGLGEVLAAQVFLATNAETAPDAPILRELSRGIAAVPSFVVVTAPAPPERIRRVLAGANIFGDTCKVLNYMAVTPCGTRLVFSARAGFREGSTRDKARRIVDDFRERFPATSELSMDYYWSGTFAITEDLIPHTGSRAGVHWALGCCGAGITMSSYMGHKVARRILGARDAATVLERPLPPMSAWRRKPALLGRAIRAYRVYDRFMN